MTRAFFSLVPMPLGNPARLSPDGADPCKSQTRYDPQDCHRLI